MTFSDLLADLNPQQRQAVTASAGPTLVIAGPGSGKTAVLTRRVAFLIREMDVTPYRIMAVTFTNKAAAEMRERIERMLGTQMKGLTIGTFHAICARILRREAEVIGLKRDFVIYDTDDQLAIMKQAVAEAGLEDDRSKVRYYLDRVSNAKNELIFPEAYPDGNPDDRVTKRLYRRYQELLRLSNALDFDDLLTETVRLFQRHPELQERYRQSYEHILVDEFQDTNVAQYRLVWMLAGEEGSLFCVGDPDQSIYLFRGADYRNVNRFQQDYPNTQIILLEENYRSPQVILDAATAIIDKNPGRVQKQLRTSRGEGQKINLKQLLDENDEAQYVVWKILEYQRSGAYMFRDCAVMYRTNAQSRALEDTFIRANVPYRLLGGVRFYSRKEVRDVLAYLRLVLNPDDSVSLRRVINVPPRNIGKKTVEQLESWAAARDQGLFAAIQAVVHEKDAPFGARAANALAEFAALVTRWRGLKDSLPVGDLLKDILEQTAYTAYIDDNTPEGRERIENVLELYRVAAGAGEKNLEEFLEEIALVSDVDNYDEHAEGAVLLTLHAAKGLEFPVVFITGLEEGIMPHQLSAEDEEQMAEERRLMYVGLTRAKDVLHLTWARRRSFYGNLGEQAVPSRFLSDIPTRLTVGSPVPVHAGDRWATYQAEYRRATTWTPPAPPNRTRTRPALLSSFYRTGQRVRHERFGDGVIIASKIRGEDEEIDVRFDRFGIKRLSASIAPMTLIEDED